MVIDLSNYSDIIWDWNGTLLNDVKLCASTMNELLEMESLPFISLETYRNIFTFPVEEYYRKAGHVFRNNSFEILGKEFIKRYEINKGCCSLFPGANELLEFIHSNNIDLHILSAYEQNSLDNILNQFSIKKYFKYVVGLDNIYADGKMILAEKLMGVINSNPQKKKVLMIGDTLHDSEVASHINVDCVLIANGHQSRSRLEESGMIIFEDLNELIKSISFNGRKL